MFIFKSNQMIAKIGLSMIIIGFLIIVASFIFLNCDVETFLSHINYNFGPVWFSK